MNKLAIGTGLLLAMYALGTFLLDDKKSPEVNNDKTPNKIVSVSLVHDGAIVTPAGSQVA